MRSKRTVLGICFVIGLFGGTQATYGAVPTLPAKIVEIGELGPQVGVQLNVGDTLRLMLPANPSTGYGWQVGDNDGTILQASSPRNVPATHPKPGAPGKQSLTFIAKAAGNDRLLLNYSRPWEKNTRPARTYTVEVTVGSAGHETPVVTPAGTLLGTYGGKLPCADCSAIQTTIALYAAGPQSSTDAYYVRTMKYLGAPKGDTTSINAGSWLLKKGTPADPNAIVYSLRSNESNSLENYQLQGDTLIALGSDWKPIQAPFNMNLKKQP